MYCYEDAFSLSIVKDTNMNYCILSNENTISNIIVCENDEIAYQFGAVPSYDGIRIGDPYDPPPEPEPEPTAEDVTLDMLADHEERLCMLELTTTTV